MKVLLASLDRGFSRSGPGEDTVSRHARYARALAALSPRSRLYVVAPGPRGARRGGPRLAVITVPRPILALALPALALRLRPLSLVTAQTLGDDGLAGLAAARLSGAPFLAQLHASTDTLSGWRRPAARVVLKGAAMVRVVTAEAKERLSSLYGLSPDKIEVLPVGVEAAPGHLSAPAGRQILYVGRLSPEKGVDLLLEAFPSLPPDARLVIAGEGPEEDRLKEKAKALGANGRITFRPNVQQAELDKLYRDSLVLALPSSQESYGRVILEAYWRGRAVVATDTEGGRALVQDGKTGWLVPKGDAAALARALSSALGSPAEAAQRGAAGRAYVEAMPASTPEAVAGLWRRAAASSGSRLLWLCYAVDQDDFVLAFGVDWIRAASGHAAAIDVVAMKVGRHDLPANVKIFPLGRWKAWSLVKTLWRLTGSQGYRHCFVHMAHKLAVAASPVLKLRGIPLTLWYTHRSVTPGLLMAEILADRVVTASAESFRVRSRKVRVLGHGIDTAIFSPGDGGPRSGFTTLSLGRVAPVKRLEVLLEAAARLKREGLAVRIAGTVYEGDRAYADSLREKAKVLGDAAVFAGPVPYPAVAEYRKADVFVNLSATDSLDKAALEAMACGVPVLSSNEALARMLAPFGLAIPKDDPAALAAALGRLAALPAGERRSLGLRLRGLVVERHGLERLSRRLVEDML